MDRFGIIQSEKSISLARFDEVSLVSACLSLSYARKSRATPMTIDGLHSLFQLLTRRFVGQIVHSVYYKKKKRNVYAN